MRAASWRGRSVGLAWLVAAALALTGCAGGARADFAQEFRGDPAVEELELTTGDNMPFTDGVRATVTTTEGLSDAETSALLGRLSAFMRAHPDEPVTIVVHAGATAVPVFGDESVTLEARDAAGAIATEPGVESVELYADSGADRISAVSVRISPDLDVAFAVARSAPAVLARLAAADGLDLTVKDAGTTIRISGVPGPWLDDAEASWSLVSAAFPVTGVHADADAINLTLADEADAPGAQALIPRAEPSFQTPIAFASPLVLLGLNSTGEEARLMLSRLDDQTRSLILSVWSNDVRAEFSVASAADVAVVESALAALPLASRGGLEVVVEVEQS